MFVFTNGNGNGKLISAETEAPNYVQENLLLDQITSAKNFAIRYFSETFLAHIFCKNGW